MTADEAVRTVRRARVRETLREAGLHPICAKAYARYGFLDPGEMLSLAIDRVGSDWLPELDAENEPWPLLAPSTARPAPADGISRATVAAMGFAGFLSALESARDAAADMLAIAPPPTRGGETFHEMATRTGLARICANICADTGCGQAADAAAECLMSDARTAWRDGQWAGTLPDGTDRALAVMQRPFHFHIEAMATAESGTLLDRRQRAQETEPDAGATDELVALGLGIIPGENPDHLRRRIETSIVAPARSVFSLDHDAPIRRAAMTAACRTLRHWSTLRLREAAER